MAMLNRDANPTRQNGPSISIAMATYNGAAFLKDQLASLGAQTLLPTELVLTDDCSTDATLEIARDFARAAPFAVHIHQNPARLGYRANFMRAMSFCSGDLIAFCDQDDVWHSNKLAMMISYFGDPDVLLVHHNAQLINAQGRSLGPLWPQAPQPPIANPLTLEPWFTVLGFTQMFRRAIGEMSEGWSRSIAPNVDGHPMTHDQWIVFLASALGKVAYLHANLAQYRQHASNTEGWDWKAADFLQRMHYRLEDRTRVYDRLRRSSLHRAEVLRHLPSDIPEAWRNGAAPGQRSGKPWQNRTR
jgi:glycosyltransferase involved in cell wall biosynthesis